MAMFVPSAPLEAIAGYPSSQNRPCAVGRKPSLNARLGVEGREQGEGEPSLELKLGHTLYLARLSFVLSVATILFLIASNA